MCPSLLLRTRLPASIRVTIWVASLSPATKSMAVKRFLDTNILLYAYDLDAPEKRRVAGTLVEEAWRLPGQTAISVQVLQSRWQLSLWDSMILAAARTSGAGELLTEDLNHGQDYGGVRVVNPFK